MSSLTSYNVAREEKEEEEEKYRPGPTRGQRADAQHRLVELLRVDVGAARGAEQLCALRVREPGAYTRPLFGSTQAHSAGQGCIEGLFRGCLRGFSGY